MFLVQVHTDVASISRSLLDRTLNALVEGVAEEALQCFRTVKKFGMGGMLRVCISLSSTASLIHRMLMSNVCVTYFRRLWKSSSSTKQHHASSLPWPSRNSRRCTIRSRRRTFAGLAMI